MTLDSNLRANLRRYLPDELLEELPDPQALTAAIRRLNSLHQAVSSFLPQYIADNETLYTEDYGALRPGTFMFADVSGFTALSEKLQREGGREGAEILTQIINSFFARMLEILAKSNGQLLKFAGDALLTFFPERSSEDEGPFAIRTGLRMQRAMVTEFQPIQHPLLNELFGDHDMDLSMSIGICQGQLFEAVVGNTIQRDHVIQGRLPGEAMAAEEAGDRDDVVITAKLHEKYADLFATVPVGEGFFRVVDNFGDQLDDYEFVVPRRRRAQTTALFDFVQQNLVEDLQRQYERLDGVARFVARQVVDKLAFRGDHIESENRPATVIFLHFTGFAELLEKWGQDRLPLLTSTLNRYYNIIQRTIASNGGSLTRSDPYQRGAKLLITFGAPVAHPDDPERAVTTALEMNRQLNDFNARLRDELPDDLQDETLITQRIGITHGPVFAGEVGWRSRREYTVMGDDVNLAARLMAKGGMGQIVISERVWERVRAHFETEALPLMQLKGKSEPTQAYLVKASVASVLSRSATSNTPFVGRDLQMLSLTYALQQAKGPRRRQVFALHGEAGVGKTRMAKQIAEMAEKTGFSVAWANCQLTHSQDQPVWAALLSQLLQLDRAKSERARRRLLHVRLRELEVPELEAVLSPFLFGSLSPSAEKAKRATEEHATLPKPEAADPDQPDKRTTNVYELAQTKTDLRTSGIFGFVRRRLSDSELPDDQGPYWSTVQKKTSVPNSVIRFLVALSEQTPLLLVIDDIHRADINMLSLLEQVIEEIVKARIMIVVTHEPTEELDLNIRRKVRVADLDQDETTLMAMRFMGVGELGPQLKDLLWTRTSGRPLFIESLLRLLQDDGLITIADNRATLEGDLSSETLPDNVRELIFSRLDRLSAPAREVLRAASVLGDGFSQQAILHLTQMENEVRVETLLGELVHAQVIEMLPDVTYRFQHGVTQATIYESLNRMQRMNLHRTAAEFWQAQPQSHRNVLIVASHLVKAGMPMRGIELVSSAADEAEQNHEVDRAIELFTHALEIFPHDETIRVHLARLQQL